MTPPAVTSLPEQLIGGPIGNWLAIVGVVSLLYWAWRIVAALQKHSAASKPLQITSVPAVLAPSSVPPALTGMQDEDDIVVIAAAVFACGAARHLVPISPPPPNQSWASEGRWAQQNSHRSR